MSSIVLVIEKRCMSVQKGCYFTEIGASESENLQCDAKCLHLAFGRFGAHRRREMQSEGARSNAMRSKHQPESARQRLRGCYRPRRALAL
ncbi:hypothetical protein HYPGJ_20471 [Hyphomicrobium sp. GJ21]|nr:hypothetical protein HYPGJ_20471 [Hyphomicrobium sp. GJ21]